MEDTTVTLVSLSRHHRPSLTPQWHSTALPLRELHRASSESKQQQPLSKARPDARSPKQFFMLPEKCEIRQLCFATRLQTLLPENGGE